MGGSELELKDCFSTPTRTSRQYFRGAHVVGCSQNITVSTILTISATFELELLKMQHVGPRLVLTFFLLLMEPILGHQTQFPMAATFSPWFCLIRNTIYDSDE